MNTDIRIDVGLFEHPKFVKLTMRLGAEGGLALLRLWRFAAVNKPDGDLSGMDDDDLSIAANYKSTPSKLVKTLLELHWIDGKKGEYCLHHWTEHQPFASNAPQRSMMSTYAAQCRWAKAMGLPAPPRPTLPSENASNPHSAPHAGRNADVCAPQCAPHQSAMPLPTIPTIPSLPKPAAPPAQPCAPAPAREGRHAKADGLAPVGSLLAAANLSLRSPEQEAEPDADKQPARSKPAPPAAGTPPETQALAGRVHQELGVNAELAAQLAKLKPERCQAWLDGRRYVKLDDKGNPGGFFRVAIADDGYALPQAYLDAQAAQAKKSERADKAAAAREQQASADAERDRLDAAFEAMPEPDRAALIAQAEQEVRSVSTLAGVLGGKRPAGWDRLVAGARRSIQAEREKPP